METRWGTSHFESRAAAIRYYRPYGYTAASVERKIVEGEIHIGPPEAKPGQTVTLNREEGRYFIEEEEKPQQNNCDGSGPHSLGEVHVMPIGGDGTLILCRSCWNRELAYRRDRNRSLGDFAKFALPPFETAKEYETDRQREKPAHPSGWAFSCLKLASRSLYSASPGAAAGRSTAESRGIEPLGKMADSGGMEGNTDGN